MRRSIIGVWFALAVLLLAGCSALRFAYGQMPEFAYWWADGYLDFNDTQKPRVRAALGDWFRWHRSTQLPEYAMQLDRLHKQLGGEATPALVCQWEDEALRRFDIAVDRAMPALAELSPTITPAQLEHLEGKYQKINRDFRKDYLQPTLEARHKAQVKRVTERFEQVYGRLGDEQHDEIARLVSASPFDADLVYAERQARQQEVVAALRRIAAEHPPAAQVQATLRQLIDRWQHSPRPTYRAYQERMKQVNCEMVARVHNVTTPAQRKVAMQRVSGWEGDLRALAASAGDPR